MGSKSKKILAARGSYAGVSIKSTLVQEYHDLYDTMPNKPTGLDKYAQNRLMKKWIQNGFLDRTDFMLLLGVHSNDLNEALLNWKKPKWTDLTDGYKGNFNDGLVHDWTAFGNNVITNDNNALKIEYVDNSSGGTTMLRESQALTTDLVAGRVYKVRLRAKISTGSVRVRVYNATELGGVTLSNTDYEIHEFTFRAIDNQGHSLRMSGMGAGEIIWIDWFEVSEYYGATALNSPAFSANLGFIGNGLDAYIDTHFIPNTDLVNASGQDVSQHVAVLTNLNENRYDLGGSNLAWQQAFTFTSRYSNNSYYRINQNTNCAFANVSDGRGVYTVGRTAGDVLKGNKGGVEVDVDSIAYTGESDYSIYLLAANVAGVLTLPCYRRIGFYAITDFFTEAEHAIARGIVKEYFDFFGNGAGL